MDITQFNALLEGSYHDDWQHSYFKLINLNVPPDISTIKDVSYKFSIHESANSEYKELVIDGPIGWIDGKILKKSGNSLLENLLERPRLICLSDGRKFINLDMLDQKWYKKIIPDIIETSVQIFEIIKLNSLVKKKGIELYSRL